jgi:hypothetical protein
MTLFGHEITPERLTANHSRGGAMRSDYKLVDRPPSLADVDCLVIRDVGTWSHKSVTNDAENVVAEMLRHGSDGGLLKEQRLFYFDSEGVLDELCHDGEKFTGFAVGPR